MSDEVIGEAQVLAVVEELPAERQIVLDLLIAGKSVADISKTTGVSRTTVYRWLNEDAPFQAAYNRWRAELRQRCRARLLSLADKATGAIERAIEAGDARAAMAMLRGMKMFDEGEEVLLDAEEIQRTEGLKKARRVAAVTKGEDEFRLDEFLAGRELPRGYKVV